MKNITKILLLFAALIFFGGSFKASAADPEKNWKVTLVNPEDILDKYPDHYVYWFYVSIKIDSKRQEIEFLGGETKVVNGSLKSFFKAVKQGLVLHQVAIGPFHTEREANYAKSYYKKSKNEISGLSQSAAPDTLNWFQCAFIEKHPGNYKIVRSPAAVFSGSDNEFAKDLFEGIQYQRVTIGPFRDYMHAEEAKRIYRKFDGKDNPY